MRSYFLRSFLLFLSILGSINAHPIPQGSLGQLQRYQIGHIVRSSGINPLIPKTHIHEPFHKRLNYQQRRHVGGAIPAFTTVVPALVKLGEAVVSVALGLTAVGSVLETVNNTQDSNVALTRAERNNIAFTCIQEVQQKYHVDGVSDEDYKACQKAAIEVIEQSDGMLFDDVREAIKVKTKEILQESYWKRNPEKLAEYNSYVNRGTFITPQHINPSITILPPSQEIITHPPVKPEAGGCQLPAYEPNLKDFILSHPPVKPDFKLPGQPIVEPKPEDFIFQRREEKKPKRADIEKPKEEKEAPKKPESVRYDKTPDSHPEIFKPVKGTPAKECPDGNKWTDDKSRHGGAHWDVLGADGNRLKEVAREDGKVLSQGLKGDSSKFNSASTDRSTRGGSTPFKPKLFNASVTLIGGFTATAVVDAQLSSIISGGRSPQHPHVLSYGAIGNIPNGPQITGSTPIIMTSFGIFAPHLGRSGQTSIGGDKQAQLSAVFNKQPGAQPHQANHTSTPAAGKNAELTKSEIAKEFGDKKTSETKEQTSSQSQPDAIKVASTTGQVTPVSTQSVLTAAQVAATAAQASALAPQVNAVTSAEIKSTLSKQPNSSSSSYSSSHGTSFAFEHALEQLNRSNPTEQEIRNHAEIARQQRSYDYLHQDDGGCTVS
jgi:hypothetical protein